MKKGIRILLAGVIVALLATVYLQNNYYKKRLSSLEKNHKFKTAKLEKVSETQYRKIVADSLTKRQMRNVIDSLGIEVVRKASQVITLDAEVREIEKVVDKIVYVNKKVQVEDYYPNKEKPFVRYTLNDTISSFKFYPINLSLALSQGKDGIWTVDSKVPEFMKITDINAVGLSKREVKKRTPFLLGAGIEFRENESPLQVIGGVKTGDLYILGSYNTKKEFGVKTIYNF